MAKAQISVCYGLNMAHPSNKPTVKCDFQGNNMEDVGGFSENNWVAKKNKCLYPNIRFNYVKSSKAECDYQFYFFLS